MGNDVVITATWKPGFERLHNADAQTVALEIKDIGDSVTPAKIVEKARDEGTELHKCFEWLDDVAAEKYRLTQAREIVRHLVIRETCEPEKTPIRYFYKPENAEGYQPTQFIMRNRDNYQSLLTTAMRELQAFRKKYTSLTELESVFESIDKLQSS